MSCMSPAAAREALAATREAAERWRGVCSEFWPRLRGGARDAARSRAEWWVEASYNGEGGGFRVSGRLLDEDFPAAQAALSLARELGVDVVEAMAREER